MNIKAKHPKHVLMLLLVLVMGVALLPPSAWAAEARVQVDLSVQQKITFTGAAGDPDKVVFAYNLEALDPANPMPDGTVGSTSAFTVSGEGVSTLVPITYKAGGVYSYRVYTTDSGDASITYDTTVYTVTVYVKNNSDGSLSTTEVIEKNGTSKVSAMSFTYSIQSDRPDPPDPPDPPNPPDPPDPYDPSKPSGPSAPDPGASSSTGDVGYYSTLIMMGISSATILLICLVRRRTAKDEEAQSHA